MRLTVDRVRAKLGWVVVWWFGSALLFGCGGEGGASGDVVSAGAAPASSGAGNAPTISGAPRDEVVVDTSFNFQPAVADKDGDSLTFKVENKPEWAQFDAKTGRLTGKPTAADVGQYVDIRISVSDGKHVKSLPAFDITVGEVADGRVTLSWTPPTSNTDGSVLSNLAGYVIHYGTEADALSEVIKITNPSISTYVVENLPSATWYFAVKAYTSSGAESGFSAKASKRI